VKIITPPRGILGRLFPPDTSKLGNVPRGSILLYLLDIGEVKEYTHPKLESDWAGNAREWDGSRWAPVYSLKESMKNRNQNSKNGILTYGNL
jgi:hypothetical protein